jgi:ABC-2 type transport system permease protein
MTTWRRVWLVAQREFVQRGRSKAYIFSALFTTGLLVALIVIPAIISGLDDGSTTYELGLVGEGNASLVQAAKLLAAAQAPPDQTVQIHTTEYADEDAAQLGLRGGDVSLVLVDGEHLIAKSSNVFGNSSLQGLMQQAAGSERLRALTRNNADASEIAAILSSDPLTVDTLTGESTDDPTRAFIAYAGLILMYMAILTYGTWTLTGVTEEKSNRVVELLLAAVRPYQLLAGKIIGIGLLGLGQLVVTVVAGLTAVHFAGNVDLPSLPIGSIASVLVWFTLGYGLYSIAFGTAGALVSRMEDAQTAAAPMTIVSVIGFFVSFRVLEDPDGSLATIFTFLPPTAPYVVPIRTAFDAIPLWQSVAAALLTVVAAYGLVRLAGRVYAGAILRLGGKVKIREAWRSAEL